ncbi:putative phosphopantothenoylcysteine decarboxylase [Golovinomyces cichoracearum]|uniref:Putative phosphopantothenoylcysteine decarboxylase n=1 Tax=Golovinomyces cichoracearum TaxID=62708 RepID=A0A420IA02_9PEZI|nr:putative phosphopantothenoylcysteine decarboxylase [Golovinomyces cichoracearum]
MTSKDGSQQNSAERSLDSTAKKPFLAAQYASDNKKHLLLCASGSVATIKIPDILQSLSKHNNLSIRLIFTKAATSFLSSLNSVTPNIEMLNLIRNVDGIFFDDDEWVNPWKRGDPILHIELRRWSDMMVIAPLSANTLAKIVNGLADNLLTSVVRAWDIEARKKIIVAPAMNTAMWNHPITKTQLKLLESEWGIDENATGEKEACQGWFEVLRPVEKMLACGDVGVGAMKDYQQIVKVIELRLAL